MKSIPLQSRKEFNPHFETERITKFLQDYLRSSSDAKGVVLGISGGIDSSVVAALAMKAFGAGKVTGVLMFEEKQKGGNDYEDAKAIISKLKIKEVFEPHLSLIIDSFENSLNSSGLKNLSRVTIANLKARARMILLYAYANQNNLLVLGTGDKSEEQVGYFTKYGDGGADILPIAHLYKTQVKALAETLGVLSRIIQKPSSPNLWDSQLASQELPVDYPELDRMLELLFEEKKDDKRVSELLGVHQSKVKQVVKMHFASKHKRELPPMIK